MNPVAFKIFNVEVRWYGILIAAGVMIGTLIAMKEARRKGVEEDTLLDLLLFAIPSALIGARIYYVVFSWDMYRDNPIEALNFRGGGLAIHGAIIAAVLVAIIFCRIRKENFWKMADITAPSLILGQAIGRWGNYINGEAHGGPTNLPWGIMINGTKVHPTFLYESIWNFLVFGFLLWYSRNRSKINGEIFLLYLILYSVARLAIEGLRTDSLMWGSIRVAQLISLIGIVLPAIILYKKRKINREF
ncbi:MAG TPA: prolipoprotein diacylglyceryl transferase [Tissierellaceae bacterium]|nr:prolipoprotein diacylglyceryl transferase [Tissierellaceae bacterium]